MLWLPTSRNNQLAFRVLNNKKHMFLHLQDELAVLVEPPRRRDPLPRSRDLQHEVGQRDRIEEDERPRRGRHVKDGRRRRRGRRRGRRRVDPPVCLPGADVGEVVERRDDRRRTRMREPRI